MLCDGRLDMSTIVVVEAAFAKHAAIQRVHYDSIEHGEGCLQGQIVDAAGGRRHAQARMLAKSRYCAFRGNIRCMVYSRGLSAWLVIRMLYMH